MTATIANVSTSTLKLKMLIDNVTNTVTGYYSFNGGADIQVGGTATLSIPTLITGKSLGNLAGISFAGVLASYRNLGDPNFTTVPASVPVYSFDNFKIEAITPVTNTLVFNPTNLSYSLTQGGSVAAQTAVLSANQGTPTVTVTKSANSDWLILPANGLGTLSFGINATDLVAGTYNTTVTASATGYTAATLTVNLTVSPNTPVLQAIKVNFQDAATVPPTGWMKDYGKAFGARTTTEQGTGAGSTTYTYGWKKRSDGSLLDLSVGGTTNLGNGRNRLTASTYASATEADKLRATLMHMQGDDPAGFNGTPQEGYWEMIVPNGVYDVSVSVGDYNVGADPESHTLNIEGINAINGYVPSGVAGSATRFSAATVRVTVTDGALTINASETLNGTLYNGTNTKINSVLIQPVSTDPLITLSTYSKNLALEPSTSNTFSVDIGTSNSQSTVVNLSAQYGPGGSNWLTFDATHNTTEPNLTFGYNSNLLVVGTYNAVVTISANGYTNAVLNVKLVVSNQSDIIPTVVSSNPPNGATGVDINTDISTNELILPPGGIDNSTITTNTVKLFEKNGANEVEIAGVVNGTGGGDAITFNPNFALNPNTIYRFVITSGVKGLNGTAFAPYEATFTTGEGGGGGTPVNVEFLKVPIAGTQNQRYTSLVIGPDRKLYGLLLNGQIKRFPINADGTLGNPETINTLRNAYVSATNAAGDRSAVGLVFDPASTASNLIAYVSHCSPGLDGAPEFDGNISRLTGAALNNHQLMLTRLPRSRKDHLVNSLAFGPDGALYFNQGSNSAAGLYDGTWQRDESLLAGATLRLDLTKLSGVTLPLNVETTADLNVINNAPANTYRMPDAGAKYPQGSYNPYGSNAPLTIFASGIRNAYDLLWHSNGQLYVPANGTASGGNTPASLAGTRRPDGTFYNGPTIPSTTSVQTQKDWLFRIDPNLSIGYFGHPNPLRGEYVLNRGPLDNPKYPSSVVVDARYRGAAYDFQLNKSPNGVLEYKSNAFNGALKGKILVCRFSGGSDIIVLPVDPTTKDIDNANVKTGSGTPGIPGMSGFANPLDIVEDVETGNLYVAEHDWNGSGSRAQITLLRATAPTAPAGVISLSPEKIIQNDVAGDNTPAASRTITIGNTGTGDLVVNTISLAGIDANQYQLNGLPTLPRTVAPGGGVSFSVVFNPTSAGVKVAQVQVASKDNAVKGVQLSGIGTTGLGGTNEPSLQAILNAYGIPVVVGDDNASTNVINSDALKQKSNLMPNSDEVSIQQFQKAGENDVVIEPLAVFGPTDANPVMGFGWYDSGSPDSKHGLFTVSNSPASNGQTVNVNYSGTLAFDPQGASFGFHSNWPFFNNRHLYSEDALNTFNGAIPHHVRVYPLKEAGGAVVPNAYIVATEEHISGFDFQDIVVIVRNVKKAASAVTKTLAFSTNALNFAVTEGGTVADQNITLSTNQGSPAIVLEKSPGSDWLLLPTNPSLGSMPFGVDATGLTAGTYNATVIASATGYVDATVQVSLTVTEAQAQIAANKTELVFDAVKNTTTDPLSVTLTNTGTKTLNVQGITITGTNAAAFALANGTTTAFTLTPQQSATVNVVFAPGSTLGNLSASLTINSDAGNQPALAVGLYGLSVNGLEGGNEPPLQTVVNTLGFGVNVGWTTLADGTAATLKGDEVAVPLFEKAGDGNVTIVPVARYSPNQSLPFGFYTNTNSLIRTEVGALSGVFGQHQTLYPDVASGNQNFNPGNGIFGIYVLGLQNRLTYTEDALNAGGPAIHAVRIYPMKDRQGQPVANSYLVCFEDASNGDYQDYVFVLSNVIPAGTRKALAFAPTSLTYTVPEGGTVAAKTATLTAKNGTPASVSLTKSANSGWLTLPNAALGTLSFGINANGLTAGSYTANVIAAAPNFVNDTLKVNLFVSGLSANAVKVNFQLTTSATPAGYLADVGLAYDATRGYGWVNATTKAPKDHSAYVRERTTSDEVRLKTLILMQPSGQTAGSWEYAAPAGQYNVTLSVGDPSFIDSDHSINVEGVPLITNFVPTTGSPFKSATATINVTDGKLTVDAIGGTNTKLNYIIIDPATPDQDFIPPLANVSLSGTLQSAGVYRNQVIVTVEASDAGGSDLASTQYSLNGGAFTDYFAPLLFNTAGSYSVRAKATDGNGNVTTTDPVNFTVLIPTPSNAKLFVENLDKFPANDQLTFSLIREPWRRTDPITPYNANHDTVTVRVYNKGMSALRLDNLNFSRPNSYKIVQLNNAVFNAATSLPFTVNSGGFVDVAVSFVNDASLTVNRVRVLHDTLTIVSNDDAEPSKKLLLHSLLQNEGEGNSEPSTSEIIDAFGFKTRTGYNLYDGSDGEIYRTANADEIASLFFKRADETKPVTVRQMGAYHSCCAATESFQWYVKGSTSNATVFTHIGLDGQSLLPRRGLPNTPGEGTFTPAAGGTFGFKVSASYSDTARNADNKIGLRFFKAVDIHGKVIPNAYIVGMDYIGQPTVTNYDYQDNVYYVSNVKPEIGSANFSELAATPSALDFADVLIGTNKALTVDLKNLGQTYASGNDPDLKIASVQITGPNLNEFAVTMPADATLSPQETGTVTVRFNPISRGLKNAALLVNYNGGLSPLRVPLYGIGKDACTTVAVTKRIKSAATAGVTINGKAWESDVAYRSGNARADNTADVTSQIGGTDEDALYRAYLSSTADLNVIQYNVPVTPGNYMVRLHFAENNFTTAGSRVFSIRMENQLVLANLDIFQEVGYKTALVKDFSVTSDAMLNISSTLR